MNSVKKDSSASCLLVAYEVRRGGPAHMDPICVCRACAGPSLLKPAAHGEKMLGAEHVPYVRDPQSSSLMPDKPHKHRRTPAPVAMENMSLDNKQTIKKRLRF